MEYRFASRIAHLRGSQLRENAKKNMDTPGVISFAYGYPATEAFPMDTLRQISEKLYTQYDPNVFLQYAPTEGYPILRKLIKERLVTTAHIENDDDILLVSGATQGMELCVKVLCNEGDVVLCEEQTFAGAVKAVQSFGAVPKPIPMNIDEQAVDLEALEAMLRSDSRVKMIYLIPTFQNPLGTSMPLEKRKEIYRLARKYDVIIFEDDPYGELLYRGDAIEKIKSLDEDGRVIYAGSFSKILAPGTRVGFVMAPKPLMQKLVMCKQVADNHSSYYWQVVLSEFMLHYDFEKHVEYLKKIYRIKMDTMLAKLDELPADSISYVKPAGGFFIGCKIADTIDSTAFFNALQDLDVIVIHGNVMSVAGEGYEHYFRLNFTKPSIAEIEQGIENIGKALQIAARPKYEAIS